MLFFIVEQKVLTILRSSGRLYDNFTGQTVEAEITAMTTSQRARDDENRAGDALSNGPLRARGKGESLSIPRRKGARQSPGICWYPDKSTGHAVNQGGTAEKPPYYVRVFFVLDRTISVEDFLIIAK